MPFPDELEALPDPVVATEADGPSLRDKLEALLGPLRSVVTRLQQHGLTLPTRTLTKTAAYTMVPGDGTVLADATAGAFAVTLPSSAVLGRMVRVEKTDASANAVTVLSASGTIQGAANDVLAAQFYGATYQSDGTNWWVVARSFPPGAFVPGVGDATKTGQLTINGDLLVTGGRPWVDIDVPYGTDMGPAVNAAIAALPASGGILRFTRDKYTLLTPVFNDGRPVIFELGASGSQPGTGTVVELGEPVVYFSPVISSAVGAITGGVLTAGTYEYAVTAMKGIGETEPSAPAQGVVGSGSAGTVVVTWANIPAADGYAIYGRTVGAWRRLAVVAAGVTTWTDTGAAAPGVGVPHGNTTGGCFWIRNGVLARGAYTEIRGGHLVGTYTRATAAVTQVAMTGRVVTITTAAPHGFIAGHPVEIEGLGAAFYDGGGPDLNIGHHHIDSVPSPTTFTFEHLTPIASVTNKVLAANVATLTTLKPHGFQVGQLVTVAGVDATFNGAYTITAVPTTLTFSYAKVAANVATVAATGTATNNADVAPTAATATARSSNSTHDAVVAQSNSLRVRCRIRNMGRYGVNSHSGDGISLGEINSNNALFDIAVDGCGVAGFHAKGVDSNNSELRLDSTHHYGWGCILRSNLGVIMVGRQHFSGNWVGAIRCETSRNRGHDIYFETQSAVALWLAAGTSNNDFSFTTCARYDQADPVVNKSVLRNRWEMDSNDYHQNAFWLSENVPGGPSISAIPSLLQVAGADLTVGAATGTYSVLIRHLLLQLLAGGQLQMQNPAATTNWFWTAQDTTLDMVLSSAQAGFLQVPRIKAVAGPIAFRKTGTTHTSGALTLTVATGDIQRITMNGAITTLTYSNPTDGQRVWTELRQDAVGGRTAGFATNFRWIGGTAPTLSTASNVLDVICHRYDSATGLWTEQTARAMGVGT